MKLRSKVNGTSFMQRTVTYISGKKPKKKKKKKTLTSRARAAAFQIKSKRISQICENLSEKSRTSSQQHDASVDGASHADSHDGSHDGASHDASDDVGGGLDDQVLPDAEPSPQQNVRTVYTTLHTIGCLGCLWCLWCLCAAFPNRYT